jgi:molybdopterin molybdotransferase
MITYMQALQIIRDTASRMRLETERIALADAVGRVCAQDVCAGFDVQPFDNAAMDGFAVRLASFTAGAPAARLKKAGVIAAGMTRAQAVVVEGCCWHVMTGAPLPAGTEAVVPVESTAPDGDFVVFSENPAAGQHIRYAGEDFRRGAPVLVGGEKICAAHILPLATLGIAELVVYRKPRVLFIPTGDEVVDDLRKELRDGEIYNANRYYASAFLAACGAQVTVHDTVRDDPARFAAALQDAETGKYDIVVSCGAVSAGSFDFVREGLEKSGARILYHKIRLKPGKPNLLAELPSGAVYFGLPGNPAATAVGLRFFVAEALRVSTNQKPEPPVYARMMNAFSKKPGLHMTLKGRLEYWEDGSITVDILDGQESFRVSPFLSMDCWIQVPEDRATVKSGEVVEVYPLLPGS